MVPWEPGFFSQHSYDDGDKWRCHHGDEQTNKQTTKSENSASQQIDQGLLTFAIAKMAQKLAPAEKIAQIYLPHLPLFASLDSSSKYYITQFM